jgi:uncharacterized protein YdbL (DUF1318 family)
MHNGAPHQGGDHMRYFLLAVTLTSMTLASLSSSYAATDCKKDISDFDAAVKTSTATKPNIKEAMKIRDEAYKDCMQKGGSATGDADMAKAQKLIGIK